MRSGNYLVFDNVISTTGGPWYSASDFNRVIGQCDFFAVQTYATNVTGTSPTVTVVSEMSGDSQNWVATGNTEINAQPIDTVPSTVGTYSGTANPTPPYPAAFMRLKISVGGTSGPSCRLKLYVTCRTNGA